MSGDSEIPPTYYFSGITFNPTFYSSASSDYLTASTGKSYFLSYPTAQGTETISTLKTSSIDTTATTSIIGIASSQTTGALNIGSNSTTATRTTGAINIGSNVVGTTPITIGMSGKSTTALNGTVSVGSSMNTTGIIDSGNISSTGNITSTGNIIGLSFQNTANSGSISSAGVIGGNTLQVSNAITVGGLAAITNGIHVIGDIKTTTGNITATAGSISAGNYLIGAYQNASSAPTASISSLGVITGSSLVLGTGAITTVGTITTTGLITAGNGIKTSTIDTATGGTMAIGASSTGGITLGFGNASTTVAGGLTVAGQITASAGMTLGNGFGITCGTTSYAPTSSQIGYYLTASVSGISAPSALTTFQTTSTLAIGIYWISFSGYFNAFSGNTGYFVPTISTSNVTSTIGTYQLGGNSGANVGYSYSGVIKVTAANGTVSFQGIWTGATATLASGSYSLIRIA
jgi:hypothetical protein